MSKDTETQLPDESKADSSKPSSHSQTKGKPYPSAQSIFADSTIKHVEALIKLDQLNEAVSELEEARRLAPGLVDHIYARTLIIRAARKERDGNMEGALADYWAARALTSVSDMSEKLDEIIAEVRHNIEEKKRLSSPMQHCDNCHRDVEPGWTHCPYCAAPLTNQLAGKTAETPPPANLPGSTEKTQPAKPMRHVTDILKKLSGKTGKLS